MNNLHLNFFFPFSLVLMVMLSSGLDHSPTVLVESSASTQVLVNSRENDSLALVAFYEATDGANWTNTWGLTDPVNTWYGVTLNVNGRVSSLDLGNNGSGNGLNGTLPVQLNGLEQIEYLSLAGNNISGSIPQWIGERTSLTGLWLLGNNFSGTIPENIWNLINLRELSLAENQLVGPISSSIGQLSQLEVLFLYENDFSGLLPASLNQAPSIRVISLGNNQFEGPIPNSWADLSSLEELYLDFNQLEGELWADWSGLPSLRRFVLSGNNFSGPLPEGLVAQTSMEGLYLFGNNFSGCFPDTYSSVCSYGQSNDVLEVGFNLLSNPGLPWNGDFDRWCNGEEQISAPCDDGDPNTENDVITSDCLCQGTPIVDTTSCRYRDSLALVALYEATSGANWTNTWDLAQPIDSWYGVELNGEGCVTEIDLFNNQLSGTMPSELGQLSNLTSIWLQENQLSGMIPLELGQLSNLETLQLFDNQLSGSIPVEIGLLSNLRSLDLFSNQLSGTIPLELGQLNNLRGLDLSSNQLSGTIPLELGQLNNLISLELSDNQLAGSIPSELGQLSNLRILSLLNNSLGGSIPPELGQLNKLELLHLANNQLSGLIPMELEQLKNLTFLSFFNNQLSGCFPEVLRGFCDSVIVSFTNNLGLPWNGDFERWCSGEEQIGAPCDDGNPNTENDLITFDCLCQGTPIVDTASCRYLDSLVLVAFYEATDGPNWLNKWDLGQPLENWYGIDLNDEGCVVGLSMPDNRLNGALPSELGKLSKLTNLSLGNNQLIGPIPPELGQLTNLVYLDLNYNRLLGPIPPELGQLTSLLRLFLHDNQLFGAIPSDLGLLSNLAYLDLGNNELTGSIPIEIYQLSNLTRLFLHDNQLTGSISSDLKQLSNLRYLYLSNNQLSGAIPLELGQLSNLEYLLLSGNQLSGAIPSELGQLTNLVRLFLHDNQISESIPLELGQLDNLEQLFLYKNQLSGCFPESMSIFCNDVDVDFSNNPGLPWNGDFQRWCNGEDQYSAPELASLRDTTYASVCEDEAFSWEGRSYRQSGIYTDTLAAGDNHCPQIRVLELMVNPNVRIEKDTVICSGVDLDEVVFSSTTEGCRLETVYNITRIEEVARAGQDQIVCATDAILRADLPIQAGISGRWETSNAEVSILFPNEEESEVIGLQPGNNIFSWILSHPECGELSTDQVIINSVSDTTLLAENDQFYFNVNNYSEVYNGNVIENDTISNIYEVILLDALPGLSLNANGRFSYVINENDPVESINFRYQIYNPTCGQLSNIATVTIISQEIDGERTSALITPNGDGKNEQFFIPELAEAPEKYPNNKLIVFNRWGQIVFQAAPYNNDWDGSYLETGQRLPAGTYYYIIELSLGSGEVRYGEVTIIR